MKKENNFFSIVWPKIIAKAWSDPNFKKKLLENPKKLLEAEGITIPEGKSIIVQECTKDTFYLTLPEKPEGELSEDKLREISAAGSAFSNVF